MLNFMIVVNDNGELKSVESSEFTLELHRYIRAGLGFDASYDTQQQAEDNILIYKVLDNILDRRAAESDKVGSE